MSVAVAPCAYGRGFLLNTQFPFPDIPTPPPEYQNNIKGGFIGAVAFPKSSADLNRADRMYLKAKAYEPFSGRSAYRDLVVEGEEQYLARQAALAEATRKEDYKNMPREEYCERYPLDDEHCEQKPGAYEKVVSIGDKDDALGEKPGAEEEKPGDKEETPGGKDKPSDGYLGPTIGGGVVVVNNQVRGGSCYPAAIDDNFKNQVLTTGRYERISPAFEKAMITVFRKEGKCGETPGDVCGYTCYGIGENCLGKSLGLTREDIQRLTRADAEDIYYKNYWQKYNIGMLPDVISGNVFMAMMGSGSSTGIKQFRDFLGLDISSKNKYELNEDVVNAVMNYNGYILNDWMDYRQRFLVRVAAEQYNNTVLTGWMRGVKLQRKNGCHVMPTEPLYR